jgi:hypothetical protein
MRVGKFPRSRDAAASLGMQFNENSHKISYSMLDKVYDVYASAYRMEARKKEFVTSELQWLNEKLHKEVNVQLKSLYIDSVKALTRYRDEILFVDRERNITNNIYIKRKDYTPMRLSGGVFKCPIFDKTDATLQQKNYVSYANALFPKNTGASRFVFNVHVCYDCRYIGALVSNSAECKKKISQAICEVLRKEISSRENAGKNKDNMRVAAVGALCRVMHSDLKVFSDEVVKEYFVRALRALDIWDRGMTTASEAYLFLKRQGVYTGSATATCYKKDPKCCSSSGFLILGVLEGLYDNELSKVFKIGFSGNPQDLVVMEHFIMQMLHNVLKCSCTNFIFADFFNSV